jgi:hypothetical protein
MLTEATSKLMEYPIVQYFPLTYTHVSIQGFSHGETMRRYFHAVLDAIGVLSSNLIISTSTKTHPKILNSSRFHLYFEVIYNTCT